MAYGAKILADSISPDSGVRLTTFEVTFPRLVLAEMNTHRVLSRNSASSRAIPVKKAIGMVREDPFVPEAFVQNQPGMSGDFVLEDWKADAAKITWHAAKWAALGAATALERLELHKALANRILEPFKWHTAIITATEWDNFLALRTDKNAQPEIRRTAVEMQELLALHTPTTVKAGEWHLPLVKREEITTYPGDMTGPCRTNWELGKKLSVGRCARVSYLTHDGKRDSEKDIELHDRLMGNGHLSPFEHVATPLALKPPPSRRNCYNWSGNFFGWHQYRKDIPYEDNFAEAVAHVSS
jgi:thymidylate synthase ThyX